MMPEWSVWMIGAGLLIVAELFSGTFYLLMVAMGLAAGGFAALLGAGGPTQFVTAAVVGVITTLLLRRWRLAHPPRGGAANDPDMNLDIGQTIVVQQWQQGRARAMYRGALWDVELGAGVPEQPGQFRIVQVRGNRLVVTHD